MNTEVTVSSEFKAQGSKAVVTLLLFISTYAIIFALVIVLTLACIAGGVAIVAIRPMLVTIALGLGLASLGFMVLIFLLKFIFKSNKIDRSHLVEITKDDQPELFAMIESIVTQVDTDFPKKVYLAPDVNASVFYSSTFWSMFFPVKKNLQIGMGWVNSVSQTELKAILSHEFGHFSQKTMRIGTYVYNVNKVIFNMLYDNEDYDKMIYKWANMNGFFSFFIFIAVKIIQGIQWILQKMYELVNKSYMALSREMEFHADEIAASVTGFEPLKNSLLRLSIADFSFTNLLNFYQEKIPENITSDNIYLEHTYVMNFFAKEHDVPIINDLPEVTQTEVNNFNKSKLYIKDQWASHPSTEDRIARLEQTKAAGKEETFIPANALFRHIDKLQKQLTKQIFKEVVYEGDTVSLSLEKFEQVHLEEFEKNTFSKVYNRYYDSKNPLKIDLDIAAVQNGQQTLIDLFSENAVDQVYEFVALQSDIADINLIADKNVPIKTFDYDGLKYNRKQARDLLVKLEKELAVVSVKVKKNDLQIYAYFLGLEQAKKTEPLLAKYYSEFFEFEKSIEQKGEIYTEIAQSLEFISEQTPYDQIKANFRNFEPLEKKLKEYITEVLNEDLFKPAMNPEIQKNFELYVSMTWTYFRNDAYEDGNLEMLYTALNNYMMVLPYGTFARKKILLDYQVSLID